MFDAGQTLQSDMVDLTFDIFRGEELKPRKILDRAADFVEESADTELLDELGFEQPEELLGFFSGTPLSERSHDQIDFGPELITLYQRAIEAEAKSCGLPLQQVIRETLWDEIAHYFGFSEQEMDQIEDFWAGD